MEIELYVTHDADTVMNKDIELKHTVEMDIKDTTNITQPIIVLYEDEELDLRNVNYAYIPEFKRYYFIRSVNVAPDNIYQLLLECDVIETFKQEILNSPAEITRGIKENDYLDTATSSEVKKDVDIHMSNKGLEDKFSIIFSTIGQPILDE